MKNIAIFHLKINHFFSHEILQFIIYKVVKYRKILLIYNVYYIFTSENIKSYIII